MTLLSELPPEIIDYIASLCDPVVSARDVPIDDLKNIALVSRVFTPIAHRRLFQSASFVFHYSEASTPEQEIFLGVGREAAEIAISPSLCPLVRAVNFREPIYPAVLALDESMLIPEYSLDACLSRLTNVRSVTLDTVAINPNIFHAVAEVASREGSSLHIQQCRIIPGTPLPFLQRPFRLQEFTLSRNSPAREMSEDYCVDILGRALLRCSATTLTKVELRLRQPQFEDLLNGMHLPNLLSLSIEHLTIIKPPSDLSSVSQFLRHHPTIQQLQFHGLSTLEIPPSSISSPRLRSIRSNCSVLQRVRTASTALRALWIDIFDKIDSYDTKVFKEILPRYFLGLRHLVFLGTPLSRDSLNCVSTTALLPHVIGYFVNLQSIYLSLDNKVRLFLPMFQVETKRGAALLILGDGRRSPTTLSSKSTKVAHSPVWWLECRLPT